MPMPGRNFNSNSYKYGFNGQEKDVEVGEGIYTAEYWEYDSRIGRRWNLDPKPVTGISDYACFQNNPILNSDPDGDEIKVKRKDGFFRRLFGLKPLIKITVTGSLINNSSSNLTRKDMRTIRKDIENEIKEKYSSEGTDIVWKGKARIKIRKDETKIDLDDHVFRLYDSGALPDSKNPAGNRPAGVIGHAPSGEKVIEIDAGEKNKGEIAAHEFGHSANQKHVSVASAPNNVMNPTTPVGDEFNQQQILDIEKDYKSNKLNNGRQKIR